MSLQFHGLSVHVRQCLCTRMVQVDLDVHVHVRPFQSYSCNIPVLNYKPICTLYSCLHSMVVTFPSRLICVHEYVHVRVHVLVKVYVHAHVLEFFNGSKHSNTCSFPFMFLDTVKDVTESGTSPLKILREAAETQTGK